MSNEGNQSRQEAIGSYIAQAAPGGVAAVIKNIIFEGADAKQHLRNRQMMLRRVYESWIEGVFETSLSNTPMIELGIQARPDLVEENPLKSIVRVAEKSREVLSSGEKLIEEIETSVENLLILGAPGSGKTTMLLDLARISIDRAQSDELKPIPVILNLSSWTNKRLSLADWLEEELRIRYEIPPKVARDWIAADELILFLDGFDEVSETFRDACIETINEFRQTHLVSLILSSRIEAYENLSTRVRVKYCLQLQPLTFSQITTWLKQRGLEQSSLAMAIRQNDQIKILAESPMMLSIMISIVQDNPADSFLSYNEDETEVSVDSYRNRLFGSYVKKMFELRRPSSLYTSEQTTFWLSWLAKTMRQLDQTTFWIEDMQTSWLQSNRLQSLYSGMVRSLGSFLFMIVCGLGTFLLFASIFLLYGEEMQLREITVLTIVISTVAGICFFINSLITKRFWVVPAIALLISGVLVSTLSTSSSSIIQVILIALFFGLPSGMAGRVLGMQKTIQITESKRWSLKMTLFGIILGLSFGLLVAVLSSENKLVRGLEAGLPLGLFFMLILGRESIGTLQDRKGSSKKILQATQRGLRMGGIVTFVIILIGTLIGSLEGNVILGLSFALFIASPIGLAVALISGGAAALRHGLLRLILLRQGVIPFYLTDFLNYAVYLAFLRNVGSGYVFIHTWLLDYFAGLTTQSNNEA